MAIHKRRQWIVALAFALALLFTALFAMRAVRHVPRRHADMPIHAWMSVPYIAHSYRVPPQALFQALGLPDKPPDRRSIRDIAREQHRSVEEVKAILSDAIVNARPPLAPPPPAQGGAR